MRTDDLHDMTNGARGPTMHAVLSHRLRSLVRTGPIHRIEANKASRARDLGRHDLRALALRAIDATIEHMGLGYGAYRSDIAEALSPIIRAVEPGTTATDVDEITDIVVEHLLNEASRRLQFDEPYVDFDGTSATTRTVRFHLLREEEADDGSIVLKATTEAINLYAGMLDVDVEDAQTAAEAVLKAQIERGAIGAAVATARQARLRSIEYGEKLGSTLRQVRRDISRVDASAMLQTVAGARKHLEVRLQVERGLIDAVEQRVVSAEVEDAPALVELKDTLTDCRRRHLQLHSNVLGMNETWLSEQERQRFRRHRASALPELERDVLGPLIASTMGDIDPILDALVLPLHAPVPPRVFDLGRLADSLLAPRRRERDLDLDELEEELELIPAVEARFDAPTVARARELLGSGGTLASLLDASRTANDAPAVRRLLVLRALWAWDPDPEETLTAQPVGNLRDPEYDGDDLIFGER